MSEQQTANSKDPVAGQAPGTSAVPAPIVVPCAGQNLDSLLSKEWLLTNGIGSYASASVVGCLTRKYHGLLVAATLPPVARLLTLSTVMEQLVVGERTYELATNEFLDAFSPKGYELLAEFRNDAAPTFIYRIGGLELTKEIMLAETNAVAIRYTLRGGEGQLCVWPFASMRDYHGLRKVHEPHQMTFSTVADGVIVQDRMHEHNILLTARDAKFAARPQWWYRFKYRGEIERGQEGVEDLYTPGQFEFHLADGRPCEIVASLDGPVAMDFDSLVSARRRRQEQLAAAVAQGADEPTRRLAVSSDAFIAKRDFVGKAPSATILAGYHWFADWGRDTFISLPGLLLCTGRLEQARQVFRTFAEYLQNGMIPNVFDDYDRAAHYNSFDASLWYIVAGHHYLKVTGDRDFWQTTIMPAAKAILQAYHDGTLFDIHADADGLIYGGSYGTQLTWMDVKVGHEPVTPRYGKPVEVNALWHCAHRLMAEHCRGIDDGLAENYAHRADHIASAFVNTFWNASMNCLYDCITNNQPDATLRPNQLLAVSLPYSPLSHDQQAGVVWICREKLLTPMGLRTLSPDDSRYRRRYGGSWESRDRAYHQGTVWPWLIGPFIEAYLKVEDYRPYALEQARQWLEPLDRSLHEAGIGFLSEICDGDDPHTPRGCIAQAWSVGEVLRVKRLIQHYERKRE